jgi:hypothetical protein
MPTHYLHILLGVMPGVAIGFLAASILASRRFRRISAEEWLAASKYYQWSDQGKNRHGL